MLIVLAALALALLLLAVWLLLRRLPLAQWQGGLRALDGKGGAPARVVPQKLEQIASALDGRALATHLAVVENDGTIDALARQLDGLTQATQQTLEGLRQVVDERLAQAVAESRSGRTELLAAFGTFEASLGQRQMALGATLEQRFDGQ